LDVEPRAELVEHAVDAPADEPAHARHQQAVERRPRREDRDENEQPEREGDGGGHVIFSAPPLRGELSAGPREARARRLRGPSGHGARVETPFVRGFAAAASPSRGEGKKARALTRRPWPFSYR